MGRWRPVTQIGCSRKVDVIIPPTASASARGNGKFSSWRLLCAAVAETRRSLFREVLWHFSLAYSVVVCVIVLKLVFSMRDLPYFHRRRSSKHEDPPTEILVRFRKQAKSFDGSFVLHRIIQVSFSVILSGKIVLELTRF